MVRRVIPFDASEHQTVEMLLPWFVNGTLEGADLALVQRHLPECGRCQREVEWLQGLREACAEGDPAPDATEAFHALHKRLDDPATPPERPMAHGRRASRRLRTPLPWVAAAEFAVILVLGGLLLSGHRPAAPFHTLGAAHAPALAQGDVVIEFEPDATARELQRVLRATGANVVAGPTASGSYLLQLPAEGRDAALRRLRAEPVVRVVELPGRAGQP